MHMDDVDQAYGPLHFTSSEDKHNQEAYSMPDFVESEGFIVGCPESSGCLFACLVAWMPGCLDGVKLGRLYVRKFTITHCMSMVTLLTGPLSKAWAFAKFVSSGDYDFAFITAALLGGEIGAA